MLSTCNRQLVVKEMKLESLQGDYRAKTDLSTCCLLLHKTSHPGADRQRTAQWLSPTTSESHHKSTVKRKGQIEKGSQGLSARLEGLNLSLLNESKGIKM